MATATATAGSSTTATAAVTANGAAGSVGGPGATVGADAASTSAAAGSGSSRDAAATRAVGGGASGSGDGSGGEGDGGAGGVAAARRGKRPHSASTSSDAALTDLEAFGGGEEGSDLGMLDRLVGADAAVALKKEKSTLKRQLKAFDRAFESKNGRQPTNEEKEPVRHLYRRYHQVKAALSEVESESAWVEESAAKGVGRDESVSAYRALRREKRALQLKLKTYEDEFQRVKGRKVRYHRDIVPVEAEYQRYKEIKGRISSIARSGGGGGGGGGSGGGGAPPGDHDGSGSTLSPTAVAGKGR
uniref:FAM13A-like domain-containing protein n=1 Tax=Bicosoecida sp. CB-2014 TaxID=1486930 RepID=A0A7S1C6C0_9STRA